MKDGYLRWILLTNMVDVYIIDDGIDEEQLGITLHSDLEVFENGDISKRLSRECCAVSHGTICAEILIKYSPSISISSIKLSKAKRTSNSRHLIKALSNCLNMNVDVIHMSLGSTTFSDFCKIHKIIKKLTEQRKIIIAGCNNENIFTVPASLPEVIGVCTSKDMEGEYYEINEKYCDGIDYIASSRHLINGKLTPLSNSCAAPFITAKVCQFLSMNKKSGINEVRRYLDRNAVNYDGISQTKNALIHTNPAELDTWYGSVRMVRDIENPVVCIYNCQLNELISIRNSFIKKGYNCLVVTNVLRKDFLETEYINFSNESIVENALTSLNTVYNPDLLVIGVYGLPDFRIIDYTDADIVCKDGVLTTDEGETFEMDKDLFSQLYSILGDEDG